VYIFEYEKDKFGIIGDVLMDFKLIYVCSCEVLDFIVKGVYFLMKKNKIEEIDGWGIFVDVKIIEVEGDDGEKCIVIVDNVIIVIGVIIWFVFGIEFLDNVVIYEE